MSPIVITSKKTKHFNREQIQHCLAVVDQLKPRGLSAQELAITQGLTYSQIRAWQSQERSPRTHPCPTERTP
jgi:hypothetical protein